MSGVRGADVLLPPPAHSILIYAALGWAARRKLLNVSGKPYVPAYSLWLPDMLAASRSKAWEAIIKPLAVEGMGYVCPSLQGAVESAFAFPGFQAALHRACEDYGATFVHSSPPIVIASTPPVIQANEQLPLEIVFFQAFRLWRGRFLARLIGP